jgi:hypothetical protein
MRQTAPDDYSRDLAAFITLSLLEISNTIEHSVAAWEKRDYWVKADRFRMEWSWAERHGKAMKNALIEDNWAAIADIAVQVAQKLSGVKVPVRHRLGTPWNGAWQHLRSNL